MVTTINDYVTKGCGRCKKFDTPQCNVHKWHNEISLLRTMLLQTSLQEEIKWGSPCYTLDKKNVCMIAVFNENVVLSFFKGAMLSNKFNILTKPGENAQYARVIRFISAKQIQECEQCIIEHIDEAILLEKNGIRVESKRISSIDFPNELTTIFREDKNFEKAFLALTLGRQRGYILHYNQAKLSATKVARIKKSIERILQGKGLHD